MLLAELCPKDIRQLQICHKARFDRIHAGWPEAKKACVVDYLDREYQVTQGRARAALCGHEAGMEEESPELDVEARADRWGAVRR